MISDDDSKQILLYHFNSSENTLLRSFFSSHGFMVILTKTLNDLIQYCREHTSSLVCIKVDGFETSWIRLITTMTMDPLIYETPLVLVCDKKYQHFFSQQQHVFHYYLLANPPSLQQLGEILHTIEVPIKPTKEQKGIMKRALCIDKSKTNLTTLRDILHRCNYKADLFISTTKASHHLAKEWNYDIALITLTQNEHTVLTLMNEMKNDPHLFLIPIIILSTTNKTETIEHCLLNGAAEYIIKPISFDILRLRLQRVMKENQLYRKIYHKQMALLPVMSSIDACVVSSSDACITSAIDVCGTSAKDACITSSAKLYAKSSAKPYTTSSAKPYTTPSTTTYTTKPYTTSSAKPYTTPSTKPYTTPSSSQYNTNKKEDPINKLRKRNHHLQQHLIQLSENQTQLLEKYHQLQYEYDQLLHEITRYSILPTISTKYAYLKSTQQSELRKINDYFMYNPTVRCKSKNDSFSQFLTNELLLPPILHLTLLRKYQCFVHKTKTNVLTKHPFYYMKSTPIPDCCCNDRLIIPPWQLIEDWDITRIEKQQFIEFWKETCIGKDRKERLYELLRTDNGIHYEDIKQLICDFLYWNPEANQIIHENIVQSHNPISTLCSHMCIYITTVAIAILFDLNGLTSCIIHKRDILKSNLLLILDYLTNKAINLVLPFAPSFTQQIITRFESLVNLSVVSIPLYEQNCLICSIKHLTSYHYLYITIDQLKSNMVVKLSDTCLHRVIQKINYLLMCTSDQILSYEGYVMFNILINDAMQERSLRFWFDIMDCDANNGIDRKDIHQLLYWLNVKGLPSHISLETEIIWSDLCHLCNLPDDSLITLTDIRNNKLGSYCFYHLLTQHETITL